MLSEIFSIVHGAVRDALNGPRYRRELERIYEASWTPVAPGISVRRSPVGYLDFRVTDAQGRWKGGFGGGWTGTRRFTALEHWQSARTLAGLPEATPPPAALLALLNDKDDPFSEAEKWLPPEVRACFDFKGPGMR